MSNTPLGRLLLIANPASHSGKGRAATDEATRLLEMNRGAADSFDVVLTEGPEHAIELATASSTYDSVIVLGGDGVIHESINGLMELPREKRPRFGIIPVGSGNDYARTLGIHINDVNTAMKQLMGGTPHSVEVGRVNGVHFMETLSFGLDAAIALDTTTRRGAGTSQEGAGLFVTSGIKIFATAKEGYACRVAFDDQEPEDHETIIFAVQVGPTYGGGFRVCPNADPSDGLLDVCLNLSIPSIPHILFLFAMARFGRHVRSPLISSRQVSKAVIDFEREPPCQIDGEPLYGTHYEVEVIKDALDVIFPAG